MSIWCKTDYKNFMLTQDINTDNTIRSKYNIMLYDYEGRYVQRFMDDRDNALNILNKYIKASVLYNKYKTSKFVTCEMRIIPDRNSFEEDLFDDYEIHSTNIYRDYNSNDYILYSDNYSTIDLDDDFDEPEKIYNVYNLKDNVSAFVRKLLEYGCRKDRDNNLYPRSVNIYINKLIVDFVGDERIKGYGKLEVYPKDGYIFAIVDGVFKEVEISKALEVEMSLLKEELDRELKSLAEDAQDDLDKLEEE